MERSTILFILIPFLFLTAILGSLSRESIISYKSPVNFTNETADTENVTEMNVETEAPFKSFRLRGVKTEFDKKYDVYLKNLGFYDNPIDVERGLPEFTLVTGFSENHAAEARHMAENIARVFPGKKLYVYGFDLPEETARWFQKACNVVFRRANFSSYPNHVTHFKNYAFKPLIIAEALQELGAVLWVDTSTIFPGRNMSTFISQLNSLNVTKTEPKMFMLGKADHNIVIATQDDMYDYIPPFSNTTLTHRNMSEGGHTLLYRTKETMDLAFRWWVLCALEVDCIAPPGAKIPCDYDLNLILDPYPKSFLSEALTIDFLRTQRDLGVSEDAVVDCSN